MTSHFPDERWSDYVRNLLPDREAAAMREHLDKGCETCLKVYGLWRTVAETAGSEARHQVPESLLHRSAAAYNLWRQLHIIPRRARMANLVSDSVLAPLPLGVRSATLTHRRILGSVGRWSFDLRLEPSGGKSMFLTGQVLGSQKDHAVLQHSIVLLMSADALIAWTQANEFGEFHLQFVRANGLRIYVDISGDQPIGMALPDLDESPAADPLAGE